MNFLSLSCAWRNLVLANYRIDPRILAPYLPRHTALDLYQGECLISIVGFLFLDTRIMGIPWPFHQKFEEFNLRFYVTRQKDRETRRAVVFLREFVPNHGIALMANVFAREKYRIYPMRHSIQTERNKVSAAFDFQVNGHWNTLGATAEVQEQRIIPGSLEDFIAEHYYGYNQWYGNKTLELQLKRPPWKYQKLLSFEVDCKFEDFYPKEFVPFLYAAPHSVQFVNGSEVDMMLSGVF